VAREARAAERHDRLHPLEAPAPCVLRERLPGTAPVIAATDYVRAYPQLVAAYLDAPLVALGTDGFGRSDTRAALRRFFEVDRHSIVVAALDALRRSGAVERDVVARAVARYGVRDDGAPWLR
jgi:pyruvate dehydrogenase E1 component